LEERPDFDHPDQWRDYNNLKDIMDKALETLPLQQKSLVLLRDYEDYAYKDIAEITGLSESQVKVYLFRARKALKDYLVKINFKEA
jgi:RNA polymerase sigma-70 factor (ECF subfamily)